MKNIGKSALVSAILSIILMVFNRVYIGLTGNMIGVTYTGGDCELRIGLGWRELTLYPEMSFEEAAVWQHQSALEFDVMSFAWTFLIIFIVALVIFIITSKLFRKKD